MDYVPALNDLNAFLILLSIEIGILAGRLCRGSRIASFRIIIRIKIRFGLLFAAIFSVKGSIIVRNILIDVICFEFSIEFAVVIGRVSEIISSGVRYGFEWVVCWKRTLFWGDLAADYSIAAATTDKCFGFEVGFIESFCFMRYVLHVCEPRDNAELWQ